MPGTPVPMGDWNQLLRRIEALESRIAAQERTQQFVFTDPTGGSGDPAHGHAVVVIGSLKAICGINAYGIAKYSGGAWTQL